MTNTDLAVDTKEVDTKSNNALALANSFSIASAEDFTRADEICCGLADLEKEIVNTFKDAKEKAFQAHRAITAAERKHLQPVQDARKVYKAKMSIYQTEMDKKRIAMEAEIKARLEKQQQEAVLEAAIDAESKGDKAQADNILNTPCEAPNIILQNDTPKAKTIIRTIKKFRILDISKISQEYMMPDEIKIGKIVRALGKDAEKTVGGIEVYEVSA